MAKTKTVTIGADGTVSGLHYDDFDLGFLGKKKIGRASEIQFDEDTQKFFVELPQLKGARVPNFLAGFSGYDGARAFEVMVLETAIMSGVEPAFTGEFYWLGSHVRTKFNEGEREPFRWKMPADKVACESLR